MDTNTLISTVSTAAPRRLQPWRVVFPDGSTTVMDASSLANAMLTAQELMPGFARIEQVGDW